MEPPYHEIAVIIEGEVEIEEAGGTVHRAGPGDVLITPKGSSHVEGAVTRQEVLGRVPGMTAGRPSTQRVGRC